MQFVLFHVALISMFKSKLQHAQVRCRTGIRDNFRKAENTAKKRPSRVPQGASHIYGGGILTGRHMMAWR